jgi:hypothetical protein
MSEAPRVELNNTDTDFDLSAQTSPFQQTQRSTPQKSRQMDSSSSPQSNGNSSQNLQNSAIKAKDSLLESKVCGTKRLLPLPRTQSNGIHHSLICSPHNTTFRILTPTKQLHTP